MFKKTIFALSLFIYCSCGLNKIDDIEAMVNENAIDSITPRIIDKVLIEAIQDSDTIMEDEMAICFVVIADSSKNYYFLNSIMRSLAEKLKVEIDSMGRTYNSKKELIALPDNDEDELYAGSYFPRRYPSQYLSLEYLSFYNNKSDSKTIVIVSGIYENKEEALSQFTKVKALSHRAYILKSKLYQGCMH